MTTSSSGSQKKARIEIIPLIDIMFFLLASFMLVSLSLVKLQGAKVELPTASKPMSQDMNKPDFTTVSVDKDGKIFWTANGSKDKDELSLDELRKRSIKLYTDGKNSGNDAKVYINGDQGVEYRKMIEVMDKLRKSGLTKVTFAVKAPPSTPAGAPAP